jgi:hypothetical protein
MSGVRGPFALRLAGDADYRSVSRLALALVVVVVVLSSLVGTAAAAPYLPPAGTVFHGGTGGYDEGSIYRFARVAGRRPDVYQWFFTPSWTRRNPSSLAWQANLLSLAARTGVHPMFHLSTAAGGHGRSVITPGQLARGDGDRYLVDLAQLIEASGQAVYVRVMAEMNNWNNPYSAFGATGAARGGDHSSRAYRQAWRRIALVLHGGPAAQIDGELRALGLPPLRAGGEMLPQPQVALLWVPFCAGLPDVRGNGPGDYWPGAAYVDWVGTDFFANSPNFRCLERLYRDRRWRRKPFAFGEWALWGRDDPGFVRRLFAWIHSHRRVRMAVYNQGSSFPALLRLRPGGAAELRRQLRR